MVRGGSSQSLEEDDGCFSGPKLLEHQDGVLQHVAASSHSFGSGDIVGSDRSSNVLERKSGSLWRAASSKSLEDDDGIGSAKVCEGLLSGAVQSSSDGGLEGALDSAEKFAPCREAVEKRPRHWHWGAVHVQVENSIIWVHRFPKATAVLFEKPV